MMASTAKVASPSSGKKREKPYTHPDRKWEVRDAMHTLMRAEEIKRNPKLMDAVKVIAAEEAEELRQKTHAANQLAKNGRISPSAMERMNRRGG